MASIEEVIDLMVANGEPEEKIMEVVNHYNSNKGVVQPIEDFSFDYKIIDDPKNGEDVVRSLASIEKLTNISDDAELKSFVLDKVFNEQANDVLGNIEYEKEEATIQNNIKYGGSVIPSKVDNLYVYNEAMIDAQNKEAETRNNENILNSFGQEKFDLYQEFKQTGDLDLRKVQELEKEFEKSIAATRDAVPGAVKPNPYSNILANIQYVEEQNKKDFAKRKKEEYLKNNKKLVDEGFFSAIEIDKDVEKLYSLDFIEKYEDIEKQAEQYAFDAIPTVDVVDYTGPQKTFNLSEEDKVKAKKDIAKKAITSQSKYLTDVNSVLNKDIENYNNYLKSIKINNSEELEAYLNNEEIDIEQRRNVLNKSREINNDIKEYQAKAIRFNDMNAALEALDKSYSNGYRFSLALENAIFADMGLLVKGIGAMTVDKIAPESKAASFMKDAYRSHINYAESVKQKQETQLPATVKVKDVGFNNLGRFITEQVAENGFSIATALTYGGVVKRLSSEPLKKYAKRALQTTFFTVEGGGSLSQMEIMQKNAAENIKRLQARLDEDDAIPDTRTGIPEDGVLRFKMSEDERLEIQKEIERNERALNYTQAQRAFNALGYGTVATVAETFGTMKFIDDFAKLDKLKLGNLSMRSIIKGTGQFIKKGPVTELVEETLTQGGHNFLDNIILKDNKSLAEGIDADFVGSVLVSSVAIGGPTVSSSVRNAFRNTFQTRKQTKEFQDLAVEYIENQYILNEGTNLSKGGINKKQADFIKARQLEILEKVGIKDIQNYLEVTNLDGNKIKELFEISRKQGVLYNQAVNLGITGLDDASIKKDRDRINKEYNDLQSQKEAILGEPANQRNKKLKQTAKENGLEESDAIKASFNAGRAAYYDALVNSLDGKVVKFDGETREQTEANLRKWLKDNNVDPAKSEEIIKGFQQGGNGTFVGDNILTFEDNRRINMLRGNDIERADAEQVAIHELQHIFDINTGLVKDGKVVSSHKPLATALKQHVESLYKNGDISKKIYDQFKQRVAQYSDKVNKNKVVDQTELLTLIGTMKRAGMLKKEQSSLLYSLKSFINKVRRKKHGDNYTLLDMKTTKDMLRYIDTFNNRVEQSDKALSQIPPEEDKTIKQSLGADVFTQINNLIPDDVKTKADFNKFFSDPRRSAELGKALSPGGLIDNVVKQRTVGDEYEKTIDGVRDRVLNYDPAAERKTDDDTPVTFAERIFSDTRFARMDARKALATKKKTTTIDTKEAKELVDDAPVTQELTTADKARTLSDFNIELEDGLVDAEIIAEVEALIEQNPTDLEARIEKLVLGDIRKKLDNAIGKIAKNKETGNVEATPEYEKFIRGEFDEIVNSLGIDVIRKSYNAWFEQTKVGRQDYKNIDPVTGKVSNFRKDVFINKANKIKYIKFFLQGKPNVLRERRTALLRRIAKRKADIAIDNYIENNSNNIDNILEAKLRRISRTAQDVQNELKTFDSVKFSKGIKLDFEKIKNEVKNNGFYINPFTKEKQTFADNGRIWEQAFANYFDRQNIPGLKVLSTQVGETGGMADFVFEILGEKENHEIKAGLKGVRMGSVLISNLNLKTGKYTLANKVHDNIDGLKDLIEKQIIPNLRRKINFINGQIEIYNKENNTNFKKLSGNITKGKPVDINSDEIIPDEVYAKITKEGGTKALGEISLDEQVIKNHYLNKKGGEVTSMTILNTPNGNATVSLKETSLLARGIKPAPMIKAKTRAYASIRTSGSKIVNGVKVRSLKVGLQFDITELLNKPQDLIDITNVNDFKNAALFAGITKPNIKNINDLSKAVRAARTTVKQSRGMSTFDFDETLIDKGKNFIIATDPATGEQIQISSGDWPIQGPKYAEQGYEFDFKDFVNVRGGVDGPLLQKMKNQIKKFGPKNVFVLTARPPESATAIHEWLKTKGVDIPFENITGLGNSTGEAKALWMLEKFAEGYNDMYFVDDALPNVKAVKNALEQLDIKSKVRQAKTKFSKGISVDFNKILEDVTGIEANKRFSDMKARKRGKSKGKFRFFIPPSHEDFVGLLYNFMGKGKVGDAHRDFFEKALVRPLNRAYRELDTAKQAIANDYKALNKQFPEIKKKLRKDIPDGDFTFEDAIRVYIWNKHGYDIPGLSKTDQANLVELVVNDPQLISYAEAVNIISKQDTYVDPDQGWDGGNIKTDLIDATGRVGRAQFFEEFKENADLMFSPENLNKIEAAYGKDFRSALEDILHRISTGINRPKGQHATVNAFMNYLNGSVGTVMFFNVRSAILQQMSIVNYINFADNNIFAAAKAFANQKQYWEDFAFIFNSDMLKQRRGGIGTDINGNDLAQAVAGSKNPSKVVVSRLLQLGFLPTQIGDNIAIATGGATFYRNRINKYIKDGLSKKEAEAKAFTDFQDLTQSTQQSSRPDMTSQQQASWIGKLVLNFQNITSQYNRIIKKAALDIKNGRISPPYTTRTQSNLGNLSKILYYGAIQNAVFYSLQTALFAVMFGDDEDEDQILKKRERVINGSIDSILRGSGIYGAVLSTLKNTLIRFKEQREKGYNKDESAVALELANFSPVLGIKLRQIVNAEKTLNYNENIIGEMEMFDAENPGWSAVTNYTQALTNFPANRLYQKTLNMRNALDKDYTNFQRVMFFSGYTTWSLGLGDSEAIIEAKEKAKINKENKRKSTKTRGVQRKAVTR